MREALGPDIAIMIDINQGWTADVAINQGRKIVDYDIYWLEEPVPADDFKGYKRVARERCRSVSSAARRISRATTCGRSSRTRAARFSSRSDARRLFDLREDLRARRHLGPADGAAPVPGIERAAARVDPERRLDRGHGLSEDLWVSR